MQQKESFCILYTLCATMLCAFSCCCSILGKLVSSYQIHLVDIYLIHRLLRILAVSFLASIYGWMLFRSTKKPIANVLVLACILSPIVWCVSHTVGVLQVILTLYSCVLRHKAERKDARGWMAEKEWYLLPVFSPIINGLAITEQWNMAYPVKLLLFFAVYIILARVILRVFVMISSVNWRKQGVKIVLCSEETLHINVGLSSLNQALLNYMEYLSCFTQFYAFQEDFLYSSTIPVNEQYSNGIRLLSSHLRHQYIPDWNALTVVYHQKSQDSIPVHSCRILQSYKELGCDIVVMKEKNAESASPSNMDLQMINDDGFFVVQYDERQYDNARTFVIDVLYSDIRPVLECVSTLLSEVPNDERYDPIRLQLKEIICSKNQLEAFDRMLRIVEYIAMYQAYYRLCYDDTLGRYDISRMSFGRLSEIAWQGIRDRCIDSQAPHELDKSIIDSLSLICQVLGIEFNPRVHLRYKEMFMLFVSLRNHCVHGSLIYYASHQLLISVVIVSVYLVNLFISYDCLIEDNAVFVHSEFEKPIPCFSFDAEGNRYIYSRVICDADCRVSDDLSNVEYYSYQHGIIHGNKVQFRKSS